MPSILRKIFKTEFRPDVSLAFSASKMCRTSHSSHRITLGEYEQCVSGVQFCNGGTLLGLCDPESRHFRAEDFFARGRMGHEMSRVDPFLGLHCCRCSTFIGKTWMWMPLRVLAVEGGKFRVDLLSFYQENPFFLGAPVVLVRHPMSVTWSCVYQDEYWFWIHRAFANAFIFKKWCNPIIQSKFRPCFI
jgi:hypothetical protein